MLKAVVIALLTFVFSVSVAAAAVFGQTASPTVTSSPTITTSMSPSPTKVVSPTPKEAVQGESGKVIPSGAPNTGRAE